MMGRMIGAFCGYMLAGFFGMIVGYIIGGKFDDSVSSVQDDDSFFKHNHHNQSIFFDVTFQVIGYIAKSDGRISRREIDAAEQIMRQMKMTSLARKQAIDAFKVGKSEQFDLESAMRKIRSVCHYNPALRRLFIDIQIQAAQAEGFISGRKRQIIDHVSQMLGFSSYQGGFDGFYQHARAQQSQWQSSQKQSYRRASASRQSPNLASCYRLLGLTSSTTQAQAKRAYRKLMGANHPDRMVAKGLPEEMIKLANQKTHQIKQAYQTICQHKGWKP